MELSSLQYLMGHSDAAITMNGYTHASYARAEESMQRILSFKPLDGQQKPGEGLHTIYTLGTLENLINNTYKHLKRVINDDKNSICMPRQYM